MAASGHTASVSPYRQWLGYARLMITGTADDDHASAAEDFWDLPGAAVLTAAHLLESGRSGAATELLDEYRPVREFEVIHRYLRALAASRSGRDATKSWRDLATRKPSDDREKELVAAGGLALAKSEALRGNDPKATLALIAEPEAAAEVHEPVAPSDEV